MFYINADNHIGSLGMCSMLEALRKQQDYSEIGPGLLRLTLHHNTLSKDKPKSGSIQILYLLQELVAKHLLETK